MENRTTERASRRGIVVSDKMDKTIVVEFSTVYKHPVYKKTIKKTTRVKAHDENNEAHIGDKVLLMSTRPLSKQKRYRLVKILEKAE